MKHIVSAVEAISAPLLAFTVLAWAQCASWWLIPLALWLILSGLELHVATQEGVGQRLPRGLARSGVLFLILLGLWFVLNVLVE